MTMPRPSTQTWKTIIATRSFLQTKKAVVTTPPNSPPMTKPQPQPGDMQGAETDDSQGGRQPDITGQPRQPRDSCNRETAVLRKCHRRAHSLHQPRNPATVRTHSPAGKSATLWSATRE